MNKQEKRNKKGEIIGRGIEWCTHTWNPISGCFHACQWTMPDGTVANCYAEDVAGRVAQKAYPKGFEHHYYKPEILTLPFAQRKPAKIFVGSMADVFGHWVPEEQISQVISVCKLGYWHTFQFLTKNAVRLKDFNGTFSRNCWIGASIPPDAMWNKPLSRRVQERMLHVTLEALSAVDVPVRWMSFEPLSWDCSRIVAQYPKALQWAVIGAASNGRKLYAPDEGHVRALTEVLDDQGCRIFHKGNMRALEWARNNWRNEFPIVVSSEVQS